MTEFSEFKFEVRFEFAALDFIGRNGMNKQTTCSFSFGKIITSIYTDCDYLNINGVRTRGVGWGSTPPH